MTHEYGPNEPSSLDHRAIARRLVGSQRAIEVYYSRVTTSTQADARALLEHRRPPYVVVTDAQTAGRGRLDRTWITPLGSAVLMTIAIERPASEGALRTLPLLAGVVAADVLEKVGASVALKWPNDVISIVDGQTRKLGGIITELVADAVLVGIGVNVALEDADLPTPEAISLRQLGVRADRAEVVADITQQLVERAMGGLAIADYRARCATVGTEVHVTRVDGATIDGIAIGIDDDGALRVRAHDGEARITAGDVQHVRPAPR